MFAVQLPTISTPPPPFFSFPQPFARHALPHFSAHSSFANVHMKRKKPKSIKLFGIIYVKKGAHAADGGRTRWTMAPTPP